MRGNRMWFGTEARMRWVPAPKSPAEASSQAWGASDVYLGGGGFVRNSWGSHRRYMYEWPESSSREAAQTMKSYRDGSFGRGLLYFIDPLTYDTNVLPARWADPSMTVGLEGNSLVGGVEPTAVPTSGGVPNDLPVNSAYFDLAGVSAGYRGTQESLYVPIPEGHTLHLGAMFQRSGAGGVFYAPVVKGAVGTASLLTAISNDATEITNTTVSGVDGVRVWLGRSSTAASTVTVTALTARIARTGAPTPSKGPWVGGMGHSGCRFEGVPTFVEYSGVNGGQVSYAAIFKEVGDWL